MDTTLFRKPTALLPIALSAAALAVIAGHIALAGTARQPDEGTAAHLWQLCMAAQLPAIAVFAAKWLPARPADAIIVLAAQAASVLAAMFPVWWFQW